MKEILINPRGRGNEFHESPQQRQYLCFGRYMNQLKAGLSTRDSVRNVCELSLSVNPVALPEEYSFILQPR